MNGAVARQVITCFEVNARGTRLARINLGGKTCVNDIKFIMDTRSDVGYFNKQIRNGRVVICDKSVFESNDVCAITRERAEVTYLTINIKSIVLLSISSLWKEEGEGKGGERRGIFKFLKYPVTD